MIKNNLYIYRFMLLSYLLITYAFYLPQLEAKSSSSGDNNGDVLNKDSSMLSNDEISYTTLMKDLDQYAHLYNKPIEPQNEADKDPSVSMCMRIVHATYIDSLSPDDVKKMSGNKFIKLYPDLRQLTYNNYNQQLKNLFVLSGLSFKYIKLDVVPLNAAKPFSNPDYIVAEFHDNGLPFRYLELGNNKKGIFIEFHANGIPWTITPISYGIPEISNNHVNKFEKHSVQYVYSESNDLVSLHTYEQGLQHGVTLIFQDGNASLPQLKLNYCRGQLHGLCYGLQNLQSTSQGSMVTFYETYEHGNLISGKFYNNNGEECSQINNGNGIRTISLNNKMPFLCKQSTEFMDEDLQTIVLKEPYENGLISGKVEIIDTKTNMLRGYYHMLNHTQHGEEVRFYPDSTQKKYSAQWVNGVKNGIQTTWYKNGQKESQRQLLNGHKNGDYRSWYPNGDLMILETYSLCGNTSKLITGKYYAFLQPEPFSCIIEGSGTASLFSETGILYRMVKYSNGIPEIIS